MPILLPTFPAVVYIDDRCDGCGTNAVGLLGIAFGEGKAVICQRCLEAACRVVASALRSRCTDAPPDPRV